MGQKKYVNIAGKVVDIHTDPEIAKAGSGAAPKEGASTTKQIETYHEKAKKLKDGGLVSRGKRKHMGRAC